MYIIRICIICDCIDLSRYLPYKYTFDWMMSLCLHYSHKIITSSFYVYTNAVDVVDETQMQLIQMQMQIQMQLIKEVITNHENGFTDYFT